MRMRFNGGAWDGVEFDSTYHPDQFWFRDMLVSFDDVEGDPLQFVMHSAKREHHQYVMDGPRLQDGVEVMHYR